VYWHPSCGLARERDHSHLVELSALSGVCVDVSAELIRAVYSNRALLDAMPAELRGAVEEAMAWAEDCARERRAVVEAANASLVEAW